jgi:hypothetical protein
VSLKSKHEDTAINLLLDIKRDTREGVEEAVGLAGQQQPDCEHQGSTDGAAIGMKRQYTGPYVPLCNRSKPLLQDLQWKLLEEPALVEQVDPEDIIFFPASKQDEQGHNLSAQALTLCRHPGDGTGQNPNVNSGLASLPFSSPPSLNACCLTSDKVMMPASTYCKNMSLGKQA